MNRRGGWWRSRPTLRWLAVVALSYSVLVTMMMFFEKSLIFFPSKYPVGAWDVEALSKRHGIRIEDRFFESGDGTLLHGWWVKAPGPDSGVPTVLFFHGNAGNLSHRIEFIDRLVRIPANIFVLGYRGYGRSEGSPDESGLFLDARAAWSVLVHDLGVDPASIVVFGKSLGGAVAVDLCTDVAPAGLIIESSFTSIADMAKHHYPIIPRFVIRTRMDSHSKITGIDCPKLFVHSPNDEVVPYELGRRLFEAAPEPKAFLDVPGAGHNTTWQVGGEPYFGALRAFVASSAGVCGSRESPPSEG